MARRLTNVARRRLGGSLVAIGLCAGALGAAIPCTCPGHQPGGSHGEHSAAHGALTSGAMAFKVGTDERPLIADGPDGPLWEPAAASGPDRSLRMMTVSTPTLDPSDDELPTAKPAVADGSPRLVAAGSSIRAKRAAALTTAQATKKLSSRCRKLLKAKKVSKLSKADRKRRTACLTKRRLLVDASKKIDGIIGVMAPIAPIVGPAPVTAGPGAATPTPTTPGGEVPPVATTPKKPKYQAVGVTATDNQPSAFTWTRATAAADIISFEFINADKQIHNLWIKAKGQPNSTAVMVVDSIEGGDREVHDVSLQPGEYELICKIAGHELMLMPFVVSAPPA